MRVAASLLLLSFLGILPAQAQSLGEIRTLEKQAAEVMNRQNYTDALPLYEKLYAIEPTKTLIQENLALCLLAQLPGDTEQALTARQKRARKLLLDAKAAGDNNSIVNILLEKTQFLEEPATTKAAPPPEREWIDKAEIAFSKGESQTALDLYKKAFEVNPHSYAAALYAGDAELQLKHYTEAGDWYSKAVAIDPDTETAYRYWADCLQKAGHHQESEDKYILAVVHQPYQRSPRMGLKNWADENHATILPPPITLPDHPSTGKDGHIQINMPFNSKKDDPEGPVRLIYSINAAAWQTEKFKKQFPGEKIYRDSLPEEVDNIHTMLKVAEELKLPKSEFSTSLKLLAELDKNHMLECWILLDHANNDLANDYAPYARAHIDLLAQYVAKYDVHLH